MVFFTFFSFNDSWLFSLLVYTKRKPIHHQQCKRGYAIAVPNNDLEKILHFRKRIHSRIYGAPVSDTVYLNQLKDFINRCKDNFDDITDDYWDVNFILEQRNAMLSRVKESPFRFNLAYEYLYSLSYPYGDNYIGSFITFLYKNFYGNDSKKVPEYFRDEILIDYYSIDHFNLFKPITDWKYPMTMSDELYLEYLQGSFEGIQEYGSGLLGETLPSKNHNYDLKMFVRIRSQLLQKIKHHPPIYNEFYRLLLNLRVHGDFSYLSAFFYFFTHEFSPYDPNKMFFQHIVCQKKIYDFMIEEYKRLFPNVELLVDHD